MRILLVDDDTAVAQSLAAMLNTLPGHDVRVAGTGGQALQNAMAMGGVDLMITDVVMEPMDGFSLRERIVQRYPGVRVIFISGYDLSDYAEQTSGNQVLAKPLEKAELIAALAREFPAEFATEAAPEPEAAAPEAPVETAPEPEPEPEAAPAPQAEITPEVAPEPQAETTPEPVTVEPPAPEPEPEPVTTAPVPVSAAPAPAPVVAAPAQPVPVAPVPVVAAPVAVKAVPAVASPVAVPAAPKVVAAAPKAVAAVPVAAVPTAPKVVATPAAVPVAPKAVATPTAVPTAPKAVAAPTAVPTAPKAVAAPTAVPTAPKAVAAAAPVAVPKAVAAAPVAVPAPAAPAAPKVVNPVPSAAPAAPKAVAAAPQAVAATPKPIVAASATPATPTAPTAVNPANFPGVPKPVAGAPVVVPKTPVAVKAAPAVAKPVTAAPTVAAVPAPPPKPAPSEASMALIGQTIGAYQILSLLGEGRWGSVYAAVQTSINRPVGLKILGAKFAGDEAAKARFVADARAKAHVQHPSILAVYEAGEAGGHTFYTHEYVDGRSLAEMQAAGEKVTEQVAMKILKTCAEGLNYLESNHIAHAPPTPTSVFYGQDGHPRLGNLATQLSDEQVPIQQEVLIMGRNILGVLPPIQKLSPGFRQLITRMIQGGTQAVNSWPVLIQALQALEPKVIPTEAAKISAQDAAAIANVEAARKAQKRSLIMNVGSMAALLVVSAVVLVKFLWTNERDVEEQVHIPAGTFPFGEKNTKTQVPEFWIDKYEVTIGQYAKFLEALAEHPTKEYDHPEQPKSKRNPNHKPLDWDIYYGRAKTGQPIKQIPSDLNMPVLTVDWWDAYAYAKWKGRELPTEIEWEKAARGVEGFAFPWGNNPNPKEANNKADHDPNNPGKPGKVDGFNFWGAVDKQSDKSPFGVIGMAGNVSEWTSTWTKDKRYPIVKGGSFMTDPAKLYLRFSNVNSTTAVEDIGFRTVTHKNPNSPQ